MAFAEEKSFSLAAERLNVTQSGMSMLVQNLELSIGKVLIDRIRGNMKQQRMVKNFTNLLRHFKSLEKQINTQEESLQLTGLMNVD